MLLVGAHSVGPAIGLRFLTGAFLAGVGSAGAQGDVDMVPGRPRHRRAYKAIVDPRQSASVMRNRAVRPAVIGYFGHQWELYAMWAWIFAFSRAAFTVNRDASSARDAAFAAAAITGSGAVGCWVGGILGDRWGRTRLTRLAMALSGTCCVLIGPVAATCPGERVVPGRG